MKRFVPIPAVALAGLAVFAPACGRPGGTAHPPVVLVVMDTARRDRLSLFGYERETSPRLDALRREATLFTNAWSTSSWTTPAHASLFTGLYPAAHGATQESWALAEECTTLAEVFSSHGYRTIGIAENPVLVGVKRGFAQGFDEWHETWRVPERPGGESGALRFLPAVLDRGTGEEPLFLFLNLVTPHAPYDGAKQFRGTFAADPDAEPKTNWALHYYLGKATFTHEEIEHLSDLYDEEILYTDFVVGRVIDALRKRNLWETAVLIVTSDHGENFGERGHLDHVFSLYETTTRIPLVIRAPGRFDKGDTFSAPVQIHDLFPTTLSLAGIDAGDYLSEGVDLTKRAPPPDRPILCEYYYPNFTLRGYQRREDRMSEALAPYRRRLKSLAAGGKKLIWGSDGKHELYDLVRDPGESTDLAGDPAFRPLLRDLEERLATMLDTLRVKGRRPPLFPADTLDAATREALRGLGYLE